MAFSSPSGDRSIGFVCLDGSELMPYLSGFKYWRVFYAYFNDPLGSVAGLWYGACISSPCKYKLTSCAYSVFIDHTVFMLVHASRSGILDRRPFL